MNSEGATARQRMLSRVLSFPAVLVVSLTYLVFLLSRRTIGDPDLWWHMRNAQEVLRTHQLSLVDTFSFTTPGARVIPFEWLSEIPYYLAYKWGGKVAVFWLVFVLASAIILGVFRLSYLASRDVKNSFVVSVGAALLAGISIADRTLLFGWLYLVILLLIFETVRRGNARALVLVPPLFCLWVNSHGSWPMGMVVFCMFVGSGLVEGSWGHAYAVRWPRADLRRLVVVFIGAVAALFINPVGYRMVTFPFEAMFGANTGAQNIREFASVNFQTPWGKAAIVLICAVVLIAIFSSRRWRLDEIGFTLLALYFALTYVRFMFLAAILIAPVFASRLKLMVPYNRESDRRLHNGIAIFVLACLFVVSAPRATVLHGPVDYPEGAMKFMRAHGLHGRLFHDYVWGGYLAWQRPEQKIFIDGRFYHYAQAGVFTDYLAAMSNDNPQAVFDKYKIDLVLVPTDSVLGRGMDANPLWIERYRDGTSKLFQRASGAEKISP